MAPIQGIVFDFDGTLIDASEAICSSFNAVLRAHALAEQEAGYIKAKIGQPLLEMFAEIDSSASRAQLQAYVEEYRAYFFPISAEKTRVLPGVQETILALSCHCRLAIATSRRGDGAKQILRQFGLVDHFPVVVGIEDVTRAKPDPEPVLCALKKLGVEPACAVMVGDTLDDVVAGKRAGTLSVGVATGAFSPEALRSAGADHVMVSFVELIAVLQPWFGKSASA